MDEFRKLLEDIMARIKNLERTGSGRTFAERLAADPSGTPEDEGRIYYNTATFKFRGYANGSWTDLN
jgi:hypothetical protein